MRRDLLAFGAVVALSVIVLVQGYDGRADLRRAQVAGCQRARADRLEGLTRDRDLADFAASAASARRASGQPRIATEYEAISWRAMARIVRARSRIVDCERAYPAPALLPLTPLHPPS